MFSSYYEIDILYAVVWFPYNIFKLQQKFVGVVSVSSSSFPYFSSGIWWHFIVPISDLKWVKGK